MRTEEQIVPYAINTTSVYKDKKSRIIHQHNYSIELHVIVINLSFPRNKQNKPIELNKNSREKTDYGVYDVYTIFIISETSGISKIKVKFSNVSSDILDLDTPYINTCIAEKIYSMH